MAKVNPPYQGFEQGPIRPPSEATSLLIRVTRNCPWNKCTFCSVYKGAKFSIRPVEDVKNDIDIVHKHLDKFLKLSDHQGMLYREDVGQLASDIDPGEIEAFNSALNWYASGMESIFLQDANSLVIKSDYLVDILNHIKKRFQWEKRITSYARSHSLARIKKENFIKIKEAGLNRIHVGLETGSDKLLKLVNKGSTKEQHITAGRNVIEAGIELSEYVMPGLGGEHLSELHARETADALNQINPHFIRLRTLVIPNGYPLYGKQPEIPFVRSTDLKIAGEILLFIKNLKGITSTLKSDHMNNLLQKVEGTFPGNKEHMIGVIQEFLDMEPKEQTFFQIGRRFGFLYQPSDLQKEHLLAKAQEICRQLNVTPENVDDVIDKNTVRSL